MTVIPVIFGCLFLHQYTWDGSGCQTECVWGTCLEWNPAYLYHSRTLAEVESTISKKCRVRLHKRQLERFSGAFFYTSTHFMLVVARHNVCGVPAEVRNVHTDKCRERVYKENFSDFWVPIPSQIHM
jgi:hypothetical protein